MKYQYHNKRYVDEREFVCMHCGVLLTPPAKEQIYDQTKWVWFIDNTGKIRCDVCRNEADIV